jgi:hypothetical protein
MKAITLWLQIVNSPRLGEIGQRPKESLGFLLKDPILDDFDQAPAIIRHSDRDQAVFFRLRT